MDMQQARIRSILGKRLTCNPQSTRRYHRYLLKALVLPCRLTGRKDFPWEATCLEKGWESEAYQEMKRDHPSFMDQFELLELLPPSAEAWSIIAKVRRIEDRKCFEIDLGWLECIDFQTENYQLVEDYAAWSAPG